jgi:hypothetical protein
MVCWTASDYHATDLSRLPLQTVRLGAILAIVGSSVPISYGLAVDTATVG